MEPLTLGGSCAELDRFETLFPAVVQDGASQHPAQLRRDVLRVEEVGADIQKRQSSVDRFRIVSFGSCNAAA
jgi:hypothetical protein